ncbi:DUF1653 domain-containing protein [Sporolactobacillus shoreicorticis]|uniref:DUF1653 domain-containing protein n=1 Tax=Sporolactobacillus shoreicorticis TaxID=1923877 RepID=A0ABW5S7Q8_9BACL|nr:DUF1653 domain-containing protein [Sporolactobacillus shoreicorticis]MCO7125533.1 DUF1653 domain-containing protein [Sporolactobacillus shoreicorticis]
MRTIQVHTIYRHFKGNLYYVEDVAIDSETEREMVVYRAMYGERKLWVRPKEMFLSAVDARKANPTGQHNRFEVYQG